MIRFAQAIEKAHRFALWHRNKMTEPDKGIFMEHWWTFLHKLRERGEQWSDDEVAIMLTYSMAALRYDPPNHGATRAEWTKGGLWAPQWGSLSKDPETEAA